MDLSFLQNRGKFFRDLYPNLEKSVPIFMQNALPKAVFVFWGVILLVVCVGVCSGVLCCFFRVLYWFVFAC